MGTFDTECMPLFLTLGLTYVGGYGDIDTECMPLFLTLGLTYVGGNGGH